MMMELLERNIMSTFVSYRDAFLVDGVTVMPNSAND